MSINYTNFFLVSSASLQETVFDNTLIYIVEHKEEEGAIGVIVNRPTELTMAQLFKKMDLPNSPLITDNRPIYFGGPVQPEQGFILHRPVGQWQSSICVNNELALTSSRDILDSISRYGKPEEVLFCLGYSGWGVGQLEQEMIENSWIGVPSDPEIIFHMASEQRFQTVIQKMGDSFSRFINMVGHA